MVLLLHWSMLNYAGVVKILKKHGKQMPSVLHCHITVSAFPTKMCMKWKCLTAVCCDADKQSGVVLRAPFLSTVLQQVIIMLPCLIKGAAVSHLAGASAGPRILSIISAFLFE